MNPVERIKKNYLYQNRQMNTGKHISVCNSHEKNVKYYNKLITYILHVHVIT